MKKPTMSAVKKAGGKPANSPVKQTGPGVGAKGSIAPDRRYEVEDAMRTLMRADELRKDSKLMSDVKRHAAQQAAKMATICKK